MSDITTRKKATKKRAKRRTKAGMKAAAAATDPRENVVSRDEEAHSAGRPARIPMAAGENMSVSQELRDKAKGEGLFLRWFLGRPGRIAKVQRAYYEFYQDENGNNITVPSGTYTMYLMALPIKYRIEDQELKRSRIHDTLTNKAAIEEGEYAPDGGDSAVTITR